MKYKLLLASILFTASSTIINAQQTMKHEDTEYYEPVPKVVTPGKRCGEAPSDAIILFDGKNLSQWVAANDTTQPAQWVVKDNVFTVNKKAGNIQTRQSFLDYQLHVEFLIPKTITGTGQARGNSGVFLASLGKGDAGYELQLMDSYNNPTYVNGQAGSVYKQSPPLVNPNRPPGEWQSYDIAWIAPRFNENGSVKSPARITVLFNGVFVQNGFELKGPTRYVGNPQYESRHGAAPIKLQSHGDPSEPISFRNIWVRPM